MKNYLAEKASSVLDKIERTITQPFKRKSFALDYLDWKLTPFLNFERGFFIEAGANDGVTYSNTLYFERYAKWDGLLIEPIPELAMKCKLNRPKCIVENCALVPLSFPHQQIRMQYCNLMSLVEGARKSDQDEREHIRLGTEVQPGVEPYEVMVPAKPLSEILLSYDISEIDFLSLDVEGYELSVLKGLNFELHKPKYILVEANYLDEIQQFLLPLYDIEAKLSQHDILFVNR